MVPIQTTVTMKKWLVGDVNGDNQVDLFDLVQVASNFGKRNVAAAPTVLADFHHPAEAEYTISCSGIGRYPSAFRSRRTGTQLVDSYPNLRDYRNKLLGVDEV